MSLTMPSLKPLVWIPALILLAAPLWAGAPQITFEKSEHDFGDVPHGSRVHHDFVFKNTGDAPLKIQSVKTSCGCTAAAAKAGTIRPGKEGKISVDFDSTGRRGNIDKEVRVWSNDPAVPVVTLRIRGRITAEPAAPAAPPAPCEEEKPCTDLQLNNKSGGSSS